MRLFQVTASINCYSEGSGNKSIKLVYADDEGQAKDRFFEEIDRPGNIDKKHFTITDIQEITYKKRASR